MNGKIFSTTLLGLSGALALSAPQQYAYTAQNIRAGIVILDSATATPLNPGSVAPFAFYNLENAIGVKPAGWNINNPHAPGTVSSTIVNRWTAILGSGSSDLPVFGSSVTKRNAEYWNVYLDSTADSSLADYDVLLLNPSGPVSLNAFERERLTKFVDQGGILWIEPSSGYAPDSNNGFPIPFTTSGSPTGAVFASSTHPLLTTPYILSAQDLNIVNGPESFGTILGLQKVTNGIGYDTTISAAFNQFLPLAINNGATTMAVAHIGEGEIVVTSQGVSQILNRTTQTGTFSSGNTPVNNSYTGLPPTLETDGTAAAKLAVNIISQLQSYPGAGGGARKTGGSPVDVTAPVLSRWQQESGNVPTTAPAVYKGVTVASVGNTLVVYSSRPGSDLDQDGDPDDGIINANTGVVDNTLRDYSVGKPYDIIWTGVGTSGQQMQGPLSSPVCAEVPDGYKGVQDVVMVVDSTGTLFVYNLFPKNANNQLFGGNLNAMYALTANTIDPSGYAYDAATQGATPNAPTVSGDLAFVADATAMTAPNVNGRIWVVDLSAGTFLTDAAAGSAGATSNAWRVGGGNLNTAGLPGFTASPTVGYIPILDSSGAYDKVVYTPGISYSTGFLSPCFDSVWLGAKDENIVSPTLNGSQLTLDTRVGGNFTGSGGQLNASIYIPPAGASPAQNALGPHLSFVDGNGNSVDPTTIITSGGPTPDGNPGELVVNVNTTNYTNFFNAGGKVRIDYTIDWGADPAANTSSEERGRIVFPLPRAYTTPGAASPRRVLGPIALSPAGTMCMVVTDPKASDFDNEGSLWWIKEDRGRGSFSVTSRWALYPQHTIPLTQSISPPVFDDKDPLTQMIGNSFPPLKAQMTNWHWAGAPVIQGGQVFATATATKGSGFISVPVTVVMAFAAEPLYAQFQAASYPQGFGLTQPDFDKTTPAQIANPDGVSTLTSANYSYDGTSGTVQITNLAVISNNQIQQCLSLSQPFELTNSSIAGPQEPETFGGTWSPLHWFCVYNGQSAQGRPLVTGNTVFVAANSLIPSVLTNTFPPTYNAVIDAMDATIAPNDTYICAPGVHSWEPQVAQVILGSTGFQPDPHIKMPSSVGLSTFADYSTRLVQQILGSSTSVSGVIGGGTSLAAWGNAGIYGMARADFTICDQGRVLRSDSSGNLTYASNANLNTGPGGGSTVGNVTPFVKPSRAYPITTNEMLIVDPGANRVVKTNNSGVEERSLDHFIVDPNVNPPAGTSFVPSGYTANEPRTFNAPQDAITYSNYVYSSNGLQVSNQNAVEYWVHYLIADSGNRRLVELIDRFSVNANGQVGGLISLPEPNPNVTPAAGASVPFVNVPQSGVLLWQSPASVSGKNFDYNSISRLYLFNATNGGRYVYVAGIGSAQPSRTGLGLANPGDTLPGGQPLSQNSGGNGGVVIFDPTIESGMQVYNNFNLPDLSTTPFYTITDITQNPKGNYSTTTPSNTTALQGQGMQLTGVRSVTARTILNPSTGGGALAIMVTTSNAVYEFLVDPTVVDNTGTLGPPDWFINSAAYTAMRGGGAGVNPFGFHPAFARRLESGDVLIANSYNGKLLDGDNFLGEVLMLNGVGDTTNGNNGEFQLGKTNLGFTIRSIKFNFPTPPSGRALVSPIFADRR